MEIIHGYRNIDESGRGVEVWGSALHGGERDRGKYVIDIYMDDGNGLFKAVSAMEETYEGMLECLRCNAGRLSERRGGGPLREAAEWAQARLLALREVAVEELELDYCERDDWGAWDDAGDEPCDELWDDLYDGVDGYGWEGAE